MQQLQADETATAADTSGEPGEEEAPVGARDGDPDSVEVDLPKIQDRETFGSVVMARAQALAEEPPEKEVVWRWTFSDTNYLLLFTPLAVKFGLEVFKLRGTRGHTVYIRGPRNVVWDFKKFIWEPLAGTIREAIQEYFTYTVYPEAGIDTARIPAIPVLDETIKPNRIETEK